MKQHSGTEAALQSKASELEAKNNHLEHEAQVLLIQRGENEAALQSEASELATKNIVLKQKIQ